MVENAPHPDFVIGFNSLEQNLHDNFLKYLKDGQIPQIKNNIFLEIYNFVQHWANKDAEAEHLYSFFKKIINDYSTAFLNQLNGKPSNEIIDFFIELSGRMDILINFMVKSFGFIDFYYLKFTKRPCLIETAHEIYKRVFFLPSKEKVTTELNKLLKEEEDGKKENKEKIEKVNNIIKIMDFTHPKLVKEKGNFVWYDEIPKDKEG